MFKITIWPISDADTDGFFVLFGACLFCFVVIYSLFHATLKKKKSSL